MADRRYVWASFTCPVHDDHSPSARVHVPTGRWVCMSCKARGKASEALINVDVVLEYIQSRLEVVEVDHSEEEIDQFDIDGPGEYWLSRFSPEACREFRLGMCGEYPCYPMRDPEGNFVGIVKRNPYNEKPKYKDPKGVLKSKLLFGYEKAIPGEMVLLVEGAPDVIGAWDAGLTALGAYGSSLSDDQLDLIALLDPPLVVVAFDDDEAGEIGGTDAIWHFLEAGILACRADLLGYHDVAEMPLDLRRSLLENPDTVDYLIHQKRGGK
jgi:hypothetical protein